MTDNNGGMLSSPSKREHATSRHHALESPLPRASSVRMFTFAQPASTAASMPALAVDTSRISSPSCSASTNVATINHRGHASVVNNNNDASHNAKRSDLTPKLSTISAWRHKIRRRRTSRLKNICECHDRDHLPWTGEIHGLSQALMSKSIALRVFWWAILVLCAVLGTGTTILVVIEYLRGPTATSTTIRLMSALELPAITVCPKVPDAFNFDEMYHDMRLAIPNLTKTTALDLVTFWLGGSGLENMDNLPEFNITYMEYIARLYDTWSTGYDAQSFFDLMQAKYGYKCNDLFHYCEVGGKPKDCCKALFHRRSVMRRGICYQTRRNVTQTEADDIGRLVLSMKAPTSVTSTQYNYIQPQIIIYVNDNFDQVLDFPRFYLYPHEWNRMHFTARLVELLEHPSDCTNALVGKDANCFVRNWLMANVIEPYNCTVPYLSYVGGVPRVPTCRPQVIANEYYSAIQLVHSGSVHSQECVPGCTRWEYSVSLQQSPSLAPFVGHVFNLEASFYDLQYEHVKEVYTISVPGFMSQIGGQFGFFLGWFTISSQDDRQPNSSSPNTIRNTFNNTYSNNVENANNVGASYYHDHLDGGGRLNAAYSATSNSELSLTEFTDRGGYYSSAARRNCASEAVIATVTTPTSNFTKVLPFAEEPSGVYRVGDTIVKQQHPHQRNRSRSGIICMSEDIRRLQHRHLHRDDGSLNAWTSCNTITMSSPLSHPPLPPLLSPPTLIPGREVVDGRRSRNNSGGGESDHVDVYYRRSRAEDSAITIDCERKRERSDERGHDDDAFAATEARPTSTTATPLNVSATTRM